MSPSCPGNHWNWLNPAHSGEREETQQQQLRCTVESFWEARGISPLDLDTEKVGFMIPQLAPALPRFHRDQAHFTLTTTFFKRKSWVLGPSFALSRLLRVSILGQAVRVYRDARGQVPLSQSFDFGREDGQ